MDLELAIIAPSKRKHAEAIYDLTGKSFSRERYLRWLETCRKAYIGRSHYDWGASRIGLVGERIVTHWGVWDYQMRIGSARVRVGGIGAVTTHGEFRKRGLMAKTAQISLSAMRQAGYDMSVLFGIKEFYHRVGYVLAWPETSYVVSTSKLPAEPAGVTVRRFALRARPDIDAIYNRANAALTGTAVRPTFLRKHVEHWQGYLWKDKRGRARGYLIVGERHRKFRHIESGGKPEVVLRVLGRLARRRGAAEVHLSSIHYDSELARWLRSGDCRLEMTFQNSGGPMVRMVNLRSTLAKMAGELSQRLKHSQLASWRGELLIADPRDRVTLEINRSHVRVIDPIRRGRRPKHVIRGGDEIAQLLIGTNPPAEVVEAGRIRLSGQARSLIGALFPEQHPMLNVWDQF